MGGFQIGIGPNGASAADALNAVRDLRTTAAQQAKLDADQAQKEFNAELEIRKAGGVPYQETVAPADPNNPKGLQRRAAPPGVDPSQIVTTPGGKKFVLPSQKAITPDQQATINHQGTSDLLDALNHGARPVQSNGSVQVNGDIPVMRDDGQGNLSNTGRSGAWLQADQLPGTTFSAGNQKVYMPTQAEKDEQALRQKTAEGAATQDAQGWILPDDLARAAARHAGLPENSLVGVKLPHETVEAAFRTATTPDKPDKPDATQIIPNMVGPNGGPLLLDKGKNVATEVPVPKGSQRQLSPDAAEAAADRRSLREQRDYEANQKVVETLQGKADKLETQEDEYRQLAEAYNSAIGVANGEKYVDPMDKTRTPRVMSAEKRTAMAQGYMRYKTKADSLAKQRGSFTQEIEQRQTKRNPQTQQPAPAGGPPQRSQQAPGPAVQIGGGGNGTAGAQPLRRYGTETPLNARYQVGDKAMYKGRTVTIVGFNPDGTAKIQLQ